MTTKELSDLLSFTVEIKLGEVSDNIDTLTDKLEKEIEALKEGSQRDLLGEIVSVLTRAHDEVVETQLNISSGITTDDIETATHCQCHITRIYCTH
jgi:hypothetical protein